MARILFLTQVLPFPLNAGPKVRAYHMLRHLVKNHEVTLVSFVRADDEPQAIEHLRGLCHAVHPVPMRRSLWRNLKAAGKGLMTGMPVVVARDEIGEMATTLRRLGKEFPFDAIHADQLSMAGYGLLAAEAVQGQRPRTLLDEHNAIYLLTQRMAATEASSWRRLLIAREARAFASYEARMCRAYDAVVTVTREDLDQLLALLGRAEQDSLADKFLVIPITVDPDQVRPVAHERQDAPVILHLGTMFWPPNISGVVWFAREVLPLIHQELPETRFVVVGKDPPPEVRALEADPRIRVTGYVPDPTPYLAAADAFVVPLHAGGGMRVKILDAWLWGLPIVSTPIGAEGIQIRDEDNLLLAADAPAFARATLRLLTDPALNQRLRANGRAWVEAHYAWQSVYRQMDQVYTRLLGEHQQQTDPVS
jgi:glycosyltransferase involved in cell wall biosynthesis